MQVTETKKDGLKREFKVVLQADDINKKVETRLTQYAKKVKMPGFRPGKAPLHIVKKKHGKEVLGEVLESSVAESSQKVLTERKLVPALQPKIEISSFDEDKDLEYKMSLEIYPDIPEIDLAKIEVEKPKVKVSEKDVKDGLKRLQESNKKFNPISTERAAKKGDVVVIDFLGSVDGVEFEGGAGNSHHLELGSGQFIPGFEDQLIGSKKGKSKTVKVTFPKEYGAPHLAGKDAEFKTTVNDILESELPEANDEFSKKIGFETIDKLQEAIKEQISKDFENFGKIKTKKDLFDKLDKTCKFEVPQGMVDMEFESIAASAKSSKEEKLDKKQEKEYRQLAERRVKLGIFLAELGRKNNVAVTDDELRRAVFEQARNYPGQEQRVLEFYQNTPQALEQLKGPILEDKVVDFILAKVKIKEKETTAEDLMKFDEE